MDVGQGVNEPIVVGTDAGLELVLDQVPLGGFCAHGHRTHVAANILRCHLRLLLLWDLHGAGDSLMNAVVDEGL